MSQSLEQGKRKLTAKDAITAGALGAVCIAIRFLFMLVGGVSPYVWFATHFIDAILIGPVFMLMVAKVRKNGPFLLTSLVTGVVLVAATWMFAITGLVGGLLCELCLPFVKVGGKFVSYKSVSVDEEITQSKKAVYVLGGEIGKVEKFNLPESDMERSLVIIEKKRSTPKKYPRKAGMPTKEPLV